MRILVLTTQVPFAFGGAEIHAQSLANALRKAGHQAEIVAIPFKWYPQEKVIDHLLACRLLDLTESSGAPIDRVIGLKFPAYHIPHHNKVIWALHQYRSAFEMWNKPGNDLSLEPEGREIREAIEQAERSLLPEARAIFANSRNVAERMQRYCGIHAEPLYHPPQDAEKFYTKESEDYLYYPSRFSELKRQGLVIEALALTRSSVRVVFSGNVDNPAYLEKLKEKARQFKVSDRIEWLGLVSEKDKLDLYARCRAVVFPPIDEDYGYITLEAMLASKPVITCTDSGGPLEFVLNEVTGLVVDPDPVNLAKAMDRVWSDKAFARTAGLNGCEEIDAKGINWDSVVTKLLA